MSEPPRNDLLLRALQRQHTERTPVWMMRQAGRYLPEYRALRAKAGGFLDMCTTPELACEITLQPLRRFPLDAAILFSDILTIPHAMELGLHFVEGEGPKFRHPARTPADIERLSVPPVEEALAYVFEAVKLVREELAGRAPLIGFAGSPWTVATYIVEGGSSRNFEHIKTLMYDAPAALHELLNLLAEATIRYLNAQILAGAQAVMIFDTWGGALSPGAYREFSLAPMQKIVAGLRREHEGARVPSILFTKGAGLALGQMADCGCDALGVDWTTDLADARRLTGDRVALQGNLDPNVLYARPEVIRAEVARVLASFGAGPGHVFNLGHGIHPATPPEHVAAMLQAVHEISPEYH